jgi:hypothetical protein
MHLVALDLYNRPIESFTSRFQFMRAEYLKSTLARMGRIFPAFGIGGVSNKYIKERVKAALL